ncbi:MAG: ribonuclease P protein component [Legionellales bacterium]|nr:ribonuclease P protein component [Legionellales bacterium]
MASLDFQKSLRLQTSKAFKTVFDHVDKKFFTKGILVLVRKSTESNPRLGLVVSKKNVSLSCRRNLFKRMIRESYRVNQFLLVGLDIVVLVRRDIVDVDRKSLWHALNQLWRSVGDMRGR